MVTHPFIHTLRKPLRLEWFLLPRPQCHLGQDAEWFVAGGGEHVWRGIRQKEKDRGVVQLHLYCLSFFFLFFFSFLFLSFPFPFL